VWMSHVDRVGGRNTDSAAVSSRSIMSFCWRSCTTRCSSSLCNEHWDGECAEIYSFKAPSSEKCLGTNSLIGVSASRVSPRKVSVPAVGRRGRGLGWGWAGRQEDLSHATREGRKCRFHL
jgi:hypothetical protein